MALTHIPSQNSHSIFTATVEEKFIALKNVDYIIYFVKLKIIRMENANEKKNIVSAGNCQIVDIQRLIQSSSAKVKVENSYFPPRSLLIPESAEPAGGPPPPHRPPADCRGQGALRDQDPGEAGQTLVRNQQHPGELQQEEVSVTDPRVQIQVKGREYSVLILLNILNRQPIF